MLDRSADGVPLTPCASEIQLRIFSRRRLPSWVALHWYARAHRSHADLCQRQIRSQLRLTIHVLSDTVRSACECEQKNVDPTYVDIQVRRTRVLGDRLHGPMIVVSSFVYSQILLHLVLLISRMSQKPTDVFAACPWVLIHALCRKRIQATRARI